MNGGSSDGATIYLFEGSYSLGSGSVSTTKEWITITKDQSGRKDYTIINNAGTAADTTYMRFADITLQGSSSGVRYLGRSPAILWIDDCIIQGGGRWVINAHPAIRSGDDENDYPAYFTDTQIFDVDYGLMRGMLARNVTIKRTGNDPFVNVMCIINAVVEDVDAGTTLWHADGYQSWGAGPVNRIIYGYYGINLHGQGLFMRQTFGNPGLNNAFVNVFMEMREPGRPGSPGGDPQLNSGTLTGAWDHLLIWNCSFPYQDFTFYNEQDGAGVPLSFKNTSVIGNLFYQYIDYNTSEAPEGTNPLYARPGNARNNDYLNNHYIYSVVDAGVGCATTPHWRSRSCDTGVPATHSFGDPKIDLNFSSPIGTFGVPNADSPLLDRFPSLVPTDALGRLRGDTSDIGALER